MNKWETEPDYLEFTYKGFKCFIKRNYFKALCGYVVVPEGNKWYSQGCDTIDINCHGGLTYASEQDGNWVIGFDCTHYGDLAPDLIKWGIDDCVYRDIEYVTNELKHIVEQLILAQEDHRGLITK